MTISDDKQQNSTPDPAVAIKAVEPLEILYRDEHLVAINKPSRLLVHRSRIAAHATQFAMQILRDQIGQRVHPVHRLDRPTSGVLLFALNAQSARAMATQFQERTVSKEYLAIVRGHPPKSGEHDEPLVEKRDDTTDRKVRENKPAQAAITRFQTLESWTIPYSTGKYPTSRYSLVRIEPLTGRRHQIRRHFNHLGWPLIGDTKHGDRRHNRLFKEVTGVCRLLLTARELRFNHPITGKRIAVSAPLGRSFENAITQLKRLDQNQL